MNLAISKRSKVVRYFLLGIGLPSVLLGYLAFRGIRNDRALMEKERLDRCTEMSHQIVQSVEDHFQQAMIAAADHLSELSGEGHTISVRQLLPFLEAYPIIETVFIVQPAGTVEFPGNTLLFQSIKSQDRPRGMTPSYQSSLLKSAHQQEFVHKRYQDAVLLYQQALIESENPQMSVDILCALCRVRKKAGQWDEAMADYERLASDYGNMALANGLPAELVSRMEIGSIYLQLKKPEAWDLFISLYRGLVQSRWELGKSQFDFVCEKTKQCLDQSLSQVASERQAGARKNFKELEMLEWTRREKSEDLLAFKQRAESFFGRRKPEGRLSHGIFHKKLMIDSEQDPYLVITFIPPCSPKRVWGLWIDDAYMKSQFLPTVFKRHLVSTQMHWTVHDHAGRTVLNQGNESMDDPMVSMDFMHRFPPWSLILTEQKGPVLQTLFFSRRSIFFYIFLLIGGVLTFGLFFTFRTLQREMELTRIKTDFVAAVSHEFKNPLTSIRQFSEMLQADRVVSESRRKHYYNILVEESDRLNLMVNNILDYTKMERGKKTFTFEMFDIGKHIHEIVTQTQHRLLDTDFEIHAQISADLPYLRGDPVALDEVVTNLFDNAIKFSHKKHLVALRVYYNNSEIVISIQDWGIGIAQEELDKIFQQFYRGPDLGSKKVRGSGLGLTLVRQIVDAHKGQIEVQSKPGKGSVFTIRLPCGGDEKGQDSK